jgi:hypothetical protein
MIRLGGRAPVVLAAALACGEASGPAPAPEPEGSTAAAAGVAAPVSRVSTTDAWLDLVAQRPAAVSIRSARIVVDLAHRTALKHTDLSVASPWTIGQEIDGRRCAVVTGKGATVDVPLDGDLAPALHPAVTPGPERPASPPLALAITLRALAPKQLVTVLWNEQPIVNLPLAEAWERRTISIPVLAMRPGENQLRLHFRGLAPWGEGVAAAAVESVEVGTREAIVAGPVDVGGYFVEPTPGGSVTLGLRSDSALAFYLAPPRRARLRMEVRGRGSLRVRASTDADHREGRRPTELHQEPLRETGHRVEVDLAGYAGEPTRIEIAVGGEPGAAAVFSMLDVVARRNVSVDRRERTPRSVYVLAVEGARPDDLLAPDRRPDLANVRRLAASAVVFERAYALGAAAVPSHAALLSSVVPPVHLTVRGTFVAEGQTLLPELFERAGWFTMGVSANPDLAGDRGLTQGVDDQRVLKRSPTQTDSALAVVDQLRAQLGTRPSPRFGYLTLVDPQAPYDPPQELIGDLTPVEGAPPQHLTHMWVGRVRMGKVVPERAELDYVRRLYRGELQVVDAGIGRLFETLEEAGELDSAVVVLVGIHGEEFYEHGGAGHGRTLHEESIRVPLMVRAPGLLEPGRVTVPVDLLDLGPTLADLSGLDYPTQWQGRSLVPLVDDPQPPPRLIVSHLGDGSRAAIVDEHKLLLGPGHGRGAQRFFDLAATGAAEQPGAAPDGAEPAPPGIAFRLVRTALAWQLPLENRWKRDRWGTGAALAPAFALDHGM